MRRGHKNALRMNGALERLRVDGNTLGAFGAQALVGALQQAQGPGRNLDVSMKYCDVSARAAGSEARRRGGEAASRGGDQAILS